MVSASKEWMDQFRIRGGAPALTCRCGKTHVAIDSDDLTEEEKAEYATIAAAEPRRYELHGGVDSVTETTVAGCSIVDECECGLMARYEQFVLSERDLILGYYREIAAKAETEAGQIRSGLSALTDQGRAGEVDRG